MLKFKANIFLIMILTYCINIISNRSKFRPKDNHMPEIITSWENDTKKYSFSDSHLEEHVLFTKFDYDYFKNHLLPESDIEYRIEKNKTVSGKKLKELAQELILEIQDRKKEFKNFKILKKKDFNIKTISGNMVLKYKEYPFVLKLFIENPESFTKPYSKGWQPAGLFLMGGGINRYLSGFTRIKNLESIKEKISQHPYWSNKIDFPRKWYFLPENTRWFTLTGKNMGPKDLISIKLPAVYGIIGDFINNNDKVNLTKKEGPKFALNLSYYLDNKLDPHIDNYMHEKETDKLLIVDTEHFPSMVGLKEKTNFRSYSHWYSKLAWKYVTDKFCRSKKYRRQLQTKPKLTLPI